MHENSWHVLANFDRTRASSGSPDKLDPKRKLSSRRPMIFGSCGVFISEWLGCGFEVARLVLEAGFRVEVGCCGGRCRTMKAKVFKALVLVVGSKSDSE